MTKGELVDYFHQKIDKEYFDYRNSLYSKEKSEILKPTNIEQMFFTEVFKNIADEIDSEYHIEFLVDINKLLEKTVTMYVFDCFNEQSLDYRDSFKNYINYEISTLKEQIKPSELTLAEKLDYFYAKNNPYDRYDSVGSFSPEYDNDEEGKSQIQECLKDENGKQHIREYLYDILVGDYDYNVKKEAKMLLIEVAEYVYSQKQEAELE